MKMKVTKTERTEKEVELKPPKSFGMYTSAGDRKLHGYAQTLLNDIEKRGKDPEHAVYLYLKKYYRACKAPNSSEASDTMVREIVRGFAEDVLRACDIRDPFEIESWLANKAEKEIRKR